MTGKGFRDAAVGVAVLGAVYVAWVALRAASDGAEAVGDAVGDAWDATGGAVGDAWGDGTLNPASENNFIYRDLTAAGRRLGKWLYDLTN